MRRFLVRKNCEYTLAVEAEDDIAAMNKAIETPLEHWTQAWAADEAEDDDTTNGLDQVLAKVDQALGRSEEEPPDPAFDIVDRQDGTTPNEHRAHAARQAFIDSAIALQNTWNPCLDHGYPARLPDFTSFLDELIAWRDDKRPRRSKQPRPAPILAGRAFKGSQSWEYESTWLVRGTVVRIRIDRDSYDFQSSETVDAYDPAARR